MAEDATDLRKIEQVVALMLGNRSSEHTLRLTNPSLTAAPRGPLGSCTRKE